MNFNELLESVIRDKKQLFFFWYYQSGYTDKSPAEIKRNFRRFEPDVRLNIIQELTRATGQVPHGIQLDTTFASIETGGVVKIKVRLNGPLSWMDEVEESDITTQTSPAHKKRRELQKSSAINTAVKETPQRSLMPDHSKAMRDQFATILRVNRFSFTTKDTNKKFKIIFDAGGYWSTYNEFLDEITKHVTEIGFSVTKDERNTVWLEKPPLNTAILRKRTGTQVLVDFYTYGEKALEKLQGRANSRQKYRKKERKKQSNLERIRRGLTYESNSMDESVGELTKGIWKSIPTDIKVILAVAGASMAPLAALGAGQALSTFKRSRRLAKNKPGTTVNLSQEITSISTKLRRNREIRDMLDTIERFDFERLSRDEKNYLKTFSNTAKKKLSKIEHEFLNRYILMSSGKGNINVRKRDE